MRKENFHKTTAKQNNKILSFAFVVVIFLLFSPSLLFSQQSVQEENSSALNNPENQYEFSTSNKAIFISGDAIIYSEKDTLSLSKTKVITSKNIEANVTKKEAKKLVVKIKKQTINPSSPEVEQTYFPETPSKDFMLSCVGKYSLVLETSSFQKNVFQKAIITRRLQDFFPVTIILKDNLLQCYHISFWKYTTDYTSRPPPFLA